jgi:hypothetical protein
MVISSTILTPSVKEDKATVRSLYFRTTNEDWALDRRAAEKRPFALPAGFQPRVLPGSKFTIGEPNAPPQLPFGESLPPIDEPKSKSRRRRKTRQWPVPKLQRIERQVDPLPGPSIPRTGRSSQIVEQLREFRPVVPKNGPPLPELENLRYDGALAELRKQQERKYRFILG